MGVSDASFPPLKLKSKVNRTFVKKKKFFKERKRTVRFTSDPKIFEFSSPPRLEKSLLWWTKEERRDILDDNRDLAEDFRDFHQDKVDHCNDVYDQCCDEDTTEEYLCKSARIELPANVRGLEWGILPSSKKHRRKHVFAVLKFQAEMDDDQENKDDALGRCAVQSSRPSRMMARILGESDYEATKDRPQLRRNRCRMIPTWW